MGRAVRCAWPRAFHASGFPAWTACREMPAAAFRGLTKGELGGFFEAQQPLVVRSYAVEWPAATRWRDLGALVARAQAPAQGSDAEPLLVPVEVGESFMDPSTEKVRVDFKDLMHFCSTYKDSPPPDGTPNVYLAQHRLEEVAPQLRHDIEEKPALVSHCGRGDDYGINFWAGHCGTRSDCHWDPYQNFLVTVVGEKRVVLFSPDESEHLYARQGLQRNVSLVDIRSPDLDKFSRFRAAQGCQATLRATDAIFIPLKWWHYCENMTTSLAVNYWWL